MEKSPVLPPEVVYEFENIEDLLQVNQILGHFTLIFWPWLDVLGFKIFFKRKSYTHTFLKPCSVIGPVLYT